MWPGGDVERDLIPSAVQGVDGAHFIEDAHYAVQRENSVTVRVANE
jgi:hypothetical protein